MKGNMKGMFEYDSPAFPFWGYVSSLEGTLPRKNECRSKKGTVFVKEMNHLTTVDLQARLYTKTINNNAMFHHDFYFV